MKEKKHSILSRITAVSFVVFILGGYFVAISGFFGDKPPFFASALFFLGLGSSLFLAFWWLISGLLIFFRKHFKS